MSRQKGSKNQKIGMPFLEECNKETQLVEDLRLAFRAGEISANEMVEIWKEDSIKI